MSLAICFSMCIVEYTLILQLYSASLLTAGRNHKPRMQPYWQMTVLSQNKLDCPSLFQICLTIDGSGIPIRELQR